MPLYEFKCKACASRKQFGSELQAAQAGWGLAQVRLGEQLVYRVFCPEHVPNYIKEAVSSGAKRGGNG